MAVNKKLHLKSVAPLIIQEKYSEYQNTPFCHALQAQKVLCHF